MPAAPKSNRRGRRRLGRPRLLIVGCGDVGLRIVARVRDRFRIIATTTSPHKLAVLRAAGATPYLLDLDIDLGGEAARAAARLRRLAQRWIILMPPPPSGKGDPRLRRLRRAGTGATTSAVYVSTTGVYGDRCGALLDETARVAPVSERARRRVAAEKIVRAAPLFARVLRAPGIYAHDRLPLERLRAGTPALAPGDDVHSNHVHAEDLARLCVFALFRGRAKRVYHAVDDSQLKMGEYFDRVADHFRLPRPPRLPRTALREAVTPVLLSFMSESRRLSNRRIKRELRVRLRYPTIEDALAEIPVPG